MDGREAGAPLGARIARASVGAGQTARGAPRGGGQGGMAAATVVSTLPTYGDLAGKRALVTGGSGGIGAAIARELGRQGARVAVAYHTREEGARAVVRGLREGAGGDAAAAFALGADLRSAAAAEALFDAAVERLGAVDIVINNAGIVLKGHSEDCGAAHFDDITAVNLRAPYLLTRKLAAHRTGRSEEDARGMCVINNTSIHGTLSVEYMSLYAMTKAGLDSLTATLACELAPLGIRVNAIAPGVVPVERTAAVFAKPETQGMWLPHLPAGRLGTVEDCASLACFLALEQASGWMTGESVRVDGGMHARANMPQRPKPPAPPAPAPVSDALLE